MEEALGLLNTLRLDVVARVPLASAFYFGYESHEAMELYSGYQQQTSGGAILVGEDLLSVEQRLTEFERLAASVRSFGLLNSSPIPWNGEQIVDGAHRLSLALAASLKPVVCKSSVSNPKKFDFAYHSTIGLSDAIARDITWLYCRIKTDVLALVIHDVTKSQLTKVHLQIVQSLGDIISIVESDLSQGGIERLMKVCYRKHPWWLDSRSRFMANERYPSENGHVVIVTYRPHSKVSQRTRKLAVREKFVNLGHSEKTVHGTDTWEETLDLVEFLLHPASKFLRNGPNNRLESDLLARIRKSGASDIQPAPVFSGSSLLQLAGLRKASDLDAICSSDLPPEFDDHGLVIEQLRLSKESILEGHYEKFLYQGNWFVSPVKWVEIQQAKVLHPKYSNPKTESDLGIAQKHFGEGFLRFDRAMNTRNILHQIEMFLLTNIDAIVSRSLPVKFRNKLRDVYLSIRRLGR